MLLGYKARTIGPFIGNARRSAQRETPEQNRPIAGLTCRIKRLSIVPLPLRELGSRHGGKKKLR
jgi:hypothetical protein